MQCKRGEAVGHDGNEFLWTPLHVGGSLPPASVSRGLFWRCVGVDPTANQDDDQPATDRETFQLEFDATAEHWRVRTADNQYWSVEASGGIQATGSAQYDL